MPEHAVSVRSETDAGVYVVRTCYEVSPTNHNKTAIIVDEDAHSRDLLVTSLNPRFRLFEHSCAETSPRNWLPCAEQATYRCTDCFLWL